MAANMIVEVARKEKVLQSGHVFFVMLGWGRVAFTLQISSKGVGTVRAYEVRNARKRT